MFFLVNSKYILEYISKKQRIKQHILRIRHPKSHKRQWQHNKRMHDIITDMPLLKYLNIAKTNRLTSNPPIKRISIMISIYCPTDIFCETRHRCSILAAGALSPCVPYAESTLHSRTIYTSANAVTVPKKPSMHLIPICCFLPRRVVLKSRISWFA